MKRRPLLVLCLALFSWAPPARSADPPLTVSVGVGVTPATEDYWRKLGASDAKSKWDVPADKLFAPDALSALSESDRDVLMREVVTTMAVEFQKRDVDHPAYSEFRSLFKIGESGAGAGLLTENPALRQLLWESTRPGGDAKLTRLMDGFEAARKAESSLTLRDYLKRLDAKAVTGVLTGDQVAEKDDPDSKAPSGKKPPADRGASLAKDTLASVGFDGAQAYGAPGDRHVYTDKAGNKVSLSISSRRMPDGSIEDVVHVVNINNPASPQGATFSLRGDVDKLAAGVSVMVGGVALTLKMSPSGDDHALSLSGPGGPLKNAKGEDPMSVSQLYAYRAARVFSYGRVVEIGGREYYVSPETYTQTEGSADAARNVGYGQFAYWPKDRLDKLFAKSGARDEVDPQTFDFRSVDFKAADFGGARDLRADLIATVIRREGVQDVALPRASMGQDSKGRWWDAVLKNGRYEVQRGEPAKPGALGWPEPPEDTRRIGRFGEGVPSDWTVVRSRHNEPLSPVEGFPVPRGNTPGVMAYVDADRSTFYIRSSFQDPSGKLWTSGAQEVFGLKPGPKKRAPMPEAPLRTAPFVSPSPIGSYLSSSVRLFDGGKSGYVVFLTRAEDDDAKPWTGVGVPVIWGDRFADHKAAFDSYVKNPEEGGEWLLDGAKTAGR